MKILSFLLFGGQNYASNKFQKHCTYYVLKHHQVIMSRATKAMTLSFAFELRWGFK